MSAFSVNEKPACKPWWCCCHGDKSKATLLKRQVISQQTTFWNGRPYDAACRDYSWRIKRLLRLISWVKRRVVCLAERDVDTATTDHLLRTVGIFSTAGWSPFRVLSVSLERKTLGWHVFSHSGRIWLTDHISDWLCLSHYLAPINPDLILKTKVGSHKI